MSNGEQQQQQQVVKLISETFVKPKHEVEAAKKPLYLAPVEVLMLLIHPIQKGLLFTIRNPTTSTTSNLLENLKHSLEIALVHFYPLAGRFETRKFDDEKACTIYIDCNKGPGARIIHATAPNVSTSDILSPVDVPKFVQSLFDLGEKFVNYDCHEDKRPLLSIQVTELVDGVFIGFTMSHSVVDGTSFMHFVSMLSEIYRSISSNKDESSIMRLSRVPVFDYKPWCGDNEVTMLKLPHTELEKVIITRQFPEPLRERIFHFSAQSLARLKAMANEGCTKNAISSFQALVALMWRSITKARNLPLDQETACSLLINARTRLNPPISDDYFGNFIGKGEDICKVGELLSHELGWAAMRLKNGIMAQNSEGICGLYKGLADYLSNVGMPSLVGDYHGPNGVIIGGSARFDMYGPEFGLGKAVAVRMGFASKEDGKITANPGSEGGGSVDLEVSLRPKNMAALEVDQEFMSFISFLNN